MGCSWLYFLFSLFPYTFQIPCKKENNIYYCCCTPMILPHVNSQLALTRYFPTSLSVSLFQPLTSYLLSQLPDCHCVKPASGYFSNSLIISLYSAPSIYFPNSLMTPLFQPLLMMPSLFPDLAFSLFFDTFSNPWSIPVFNLFPDIFPITWSHLAFSLFPDTFLTPWFYLLFRLFRILSHFHDFNLSYSVSSQTLSQFPDCISYSASWQYFRETLAPRL